jgi:hypothetical protein
MRDCIFLLADKNMEAVFTGFLTRERFYLSLGIRPFAFDQARDILVESGSDPGVFRRAHALLRLYRRTHRFAVVVLDNTWPGSPGVEAIQETIQANMIGSGWPADCFEVIVLAPELEVWLWQDSPHLATAFRFTQHTSLRQWLVSQGLWDTDAAKPADPKQAVERTLRTSRMPRSSAIYRQITNRISVQGCTDPAFHRLRATLQRWFPVEDQP